MRRRARAAAAHLDRVLRREARNFGADAGPGGASDHITVGTYEPARGRHAADDLAGLADIAWRRSWRTRNRRRVFAAVVVLAVASVALLAPRRAPSTSETVTPLLPFSVPATVLVVPPFERLGELAPLSTALPSTINLDPDAARPLDEAPLTRAVALAQLDLGPLIAIADDGTTRRFDDPRLPGARMHITSLSPDGMRAALTTAEGLLVIDLTTGTARSIVSAGLAPPAGTLTWRTPRTVLTGREVTEEINVDTGAVISELPGVDHANVVTGQGIAAGRVAEMAPIDNVSGLPGRIRMWVNLRTAPPPSSDTTPTAGDLDERTIAGEPWVGRWVGPGWFTLDLFVRACTPSGLLLPPSVGTARDAIAAVGDDGTAIGTLVVVEAVALVPLGFVDAHTILVSTGVRQGRVLAWNAPTRTLRTVAVMDTYARLSVRDLFGHP